MEKSEDLISREAILEKAFMAPGYFCTLVSSWDIAKAPAVDAVPVVRCKDCIYKDGTPGQPNILCGQMKDDDFCSYGERRNTDIKL